MIAGIIYNQPEESDAPDRRGVLKAVEDVCAALDELGIKRISLPLTGEDDIPELIETLKDVDCVFNLCEDFKGRNEGEIWMGGLLEILGLPYTGSDPMSLSLCLDKRWTKAVLLSQGIPTPLYRVIDSHTKEAPDLGFPLIIKPIREDAGIGININFVVHNSLDLRSRVNELFKSYTSLIVERFIDGREVNISILDAEKPIIGISEISFDIEPRVVGYEAKWYPDSREYKGTETFYPPEEEVGKEVIELAIRAFKALQLRDYGRIDIRIDMDGSPFVLEANPNPDISRDAGFARSLEANGISYTKIIEFLLERAILRKCH